jgi:hypothetical protein
MMPDLKAAVFRLSVRFRTERLTIFGRFIGIPVNGSGALETHG